MPFLYLRKKYFYYVLVIIALLIAVYFLRPFDHLMSHAERPFYEFRSSPNMSDGVKPPHRGRSPQIDIVSIILFITILSVSTVISIIKEWQSTLQRATRAEADKAQAELSFLKAQINPHFLFNTLNNIYSLAVTKNDDTSFAIMKLSNIMRYVTDDATHDFVSLQSEVDCISDYIDLQRLRLNKKTEIDFSVTGNIDDKQIAPLLLITFVENVFKYGVSSHESSSVTIKLSADEKTITLFCQNKLFQSMRRIERTGIGLSNTKQRLEFLYPKRHLLNITTEYGLYTVLLTLQV
jgi:two-component system LytT family sensor kinase